MPSRNNSDNGAVTLAIQPAFQKLVSKSFGSAENLANVPNAIAPHLQRVTSTFEDVKKNGTTLINTAQKSIQKLKVPGLDEGNFARLGTAPNKGGVRRSASESTFQRPRWQGKSLTPSNSPPKQPGFDWLTAFNDTLNQARTKPTFQLPSKVEEQVRLALVKKIHRFRHCSGYFYKRYLLVHILLHPQAKQLVHSASNVSLERVASQILLKQKEAIETAQNTITQCQQNLQTLQLNLQQSFAEGKSNLETKLMLLSEPGNSPSGSGNRLVDLLSAASLKRKGSTGSDKQEAVPDYLRSGETSTLEPLPPTDDEQDSDSPNSVASGRNWGPFQLHANRRKKEQQRTAESSLREPGRQVTIVTTAALPWMTGTAVNPLLRAAYLAKDDDRAVTLMIPWLAKSDQSRIYPNNITFDTPDEQEQYVKDWVKGRTGLDANFKVTFYPGRYAPEKCSILPVGDPTAYVADNEADVAILEEPEHLNWYHHGRRWTDKFSHVVGVVHTNYLDYARREEGGQTKEQLLKHINSWVTRIHCHKVVKLSDAVQPLPNESTEFVHGVADSFLKVGEAKAKPAASGGKRFSNGAYFIGKAVWAKGYTELLTLLDKHSSNAGKPINVDCFGTGEDLEAVKHTAEEKKLNLHFHGARDHLDSSLHDYKVFINPSTSDVVATTTAEALAMGKWVVCADHPSNRFFSQFRNCLIYKTPEEFSKHLEYALEADPHPMDPEERKKLTWEAATERFLNATELTEKDLKPHPITAAVDNIAWATHNALAGVEPIRAVAGAGSNTKHNPARVVDYQPCENVGGLFDDKKRILAAKAK